MLGIWTEQEDYTYLELEQSGDILATEDDSELLTEKSINTIWNEN